MYSDGQQGGDGDGLVNLLTNVALHYYLPAFLLDSLTDIANADLTIFLEPLLTGSNMPEGTQADYFTKFSRFTTEQRRVVTAWLRVQAGIDEYDREACLSAVPFATAMAAPLGRRECALISFTRADMNHD